MKEDEGIFACKRLELVWCCLEIVASLLLEVLSYLLSKANVGVEACAYSCTTLSDLKDVMQCHLNASQSIL